jgi:hypothetical protein
MESLRKIGQACTQHYEKLILSFSLVVLAAAVVILYQASQTEERVTTAQGIEYDRRRVKAVEPVDISRHDEALKRIQNPPKLNYSAPHNLFNPVKWQRNPKDNTLLKIATGKEVGPDNMVATRIQPLYTTLTYDRPSGTGGYFVSMAREAAERPSDRGKRQHFVSLGPSTTTSRNPFFTLKEVKGQNEETPELVLELTDAQERVTISTNQPYKRVDGYEADLKYNVDGKAFPKLRVGSSIRVASEDYKIVAINPTEVVLSSSLNDRKYTVPLSVSP